MLLYGLLNAIFLFLVTGQAFQIETELNTQRTVIYLHNFISDVGFAEALWYVFRNQLLRAVFCRSGERLQGLFTSSTALTFQLATLVLSMPVRHSGDFIGGTDFCCHRSIGVFACEQTGVICNTIFIVLLFTGIIPLLLKILYASKITRGDVSCFLLSFSVTASFSRIHLMLYWAALSCICCLRYGPHWSHFTQNHNESSIVWWSSLRDVLRHWSSS